MSNPDHTHITVILDRSGSMRRIASDVIGGFNQLLDEQRALEHGHATLSLTQFATGNPLMVTHDFQLLDRVPPLTAEMYTPYGGTPLYDAVGITLYKLKKTIEATAEYERPGKVLIVIITDGKENRSRRVTHTFLRRQIAFHTKEGWDFVYLSADLDAFGDSDRMGIRESHRMAFDKSARGTRHAFSALSKNISSSRSATAPRDTFFDQSDREQHDLERQRREG